MAVAEYAPSRGSEPQGPTPDITSPPQISELTRGHIELLYAWQDTRFPNGEPLSRQGDQFRSELTEVQELIFGLSAEDLARLTPDEKHRIGDEISDVIIAGVGKLKVLGYSYEELREIKEKAVYDASRVSELERWQIDANGGEIPSDARLKDLAKEAVKVQKAYEMLGAQDVNSLTSNQKKKLAEKVAETMNLGLSVLNSMGESFDGHFRNKFKEMEEKYDKDQLAQLVSGGMTESEAMTELKRRWERKFREINTGEIILYSADIDQAVA